VRFPDAEVYLLSDFPVAGRLYHAGLPHIQSVDDEAGDPGERQLLLQYGKGSCASVPIKVADVLWGELYATTQLGAPVFSSRDIELLTACAAFVGAAVMHAERLEQIGRLAFEDPLTSLANRRAVDDALAAALDASGAGAALVVVDVNAFKGVNDRFGHTVGDQVLRAVGAALAAAAAPYPGATVGRVGGDEFCVVLPAISEHAAVAIVEEASSRLAEEPPPRIRIAGGVALGVAGSRPQELFMAADAAQYAAKREHLVVVTDRASRRRSASRDVVRRAHRNGHQVDWLAVLQACTDALAMQDAGSPVGDRLQVVAEVVSECLGLGRWALSYAGPDGVLRLRRLRVYRQRPAGAGGRDLAEASGVYRLADFPLTAAVVRDGGSFYVDARDPNADAAERRWLAGFGLRALLGVGVPDGDGGWLLELLAEENEALEELAPLVDLVAQLCRR
jgi:diguanylate cyclase (GGDEF)-like protein